MSTSPTTHVSNITREAWIERAKTREDFCDLSREEQDQLAAAFNQTVDPKLDSIGRVYWAAGMERRLKEGWAIPGEAPEVGFATIMSMHANGEGRKL